MLIYGPIPSRPSFLHDHADTCIPFIPVTTFTYFVINYFISTTTQATPTIKRIINFSLRYIILMALFCIAVKKGSISLIGFPFHVQVISYSIFQVFRLNYLYRIFLPIFIF